jgi:Domain of unknown function (DUF4388)
MVRRRGSAGSQETGQRDVFDGLSDPPPIWSGSDPGSAQVPGPTMSPLFTPSAGDAAADPISRIGMAEMPDDSLTSTTVVTEDEPVPSLTGSLSAFGLAEILFLLAGATHTGELRVAGDSVDGLVWFDHGALAGAKAGKAVTVGDAIFQLARVDSGWFSFSPGPPPPTSEPHSAVATIVDEVRFRLEEWKELEASVPLDAIAALQPEPPGQDVQLRAEQWPVLAAIGKGDQTVASVLDTLGMDQVVGLRAIRELSAAGLVDLLAPSVPSAAYSTDTSEPVGFAPVEEFASTAVEADEFEFAEESDIPMATDTSDTADTSDTSDIVDADLDGSEALTGLAEVTVMPPPIADDPWMRVGTAPGAAEDGGVA